MDKMKNANTIWYEADVIAILEGNGIEPTEENINRLLLQSFISGFRSLLIERVNEVIEQQVSEVFEL